jgi:hypothetical protein
MRRTTESGRAPARLLVLPPQWLVGLMRFANPTGIVARLALHGLATVPLDVHRVCLCTSRFPIETGGPSRRPVVQSSVCQVRAILCDERVHSVHLKPAAVEG